jgi:hypothetical protein
VWKVDFCHPHPISELEEVTFRLSVLLWYRATRPRCPRTPALNRGNPHCCLQNYIPGLSIGVKMVTREDLVALAKQNAMRRSTFGFGVLAELANQVGPSESPRCLAKIHQVVQWDTAGTKRQ